MKEVRGLGVGGPLALMARGGLVLSFTGGMMGGGASTTGVGEDGW